MVTLPPNTDEVTEGDEDDNEANMNEMWQGEYT